MIEGDRGLVVKRTITEVREIPPGWEITISPPSIPSPAVIEEGQPGLLLLAFLFILGFGWGMLGGGIVGTFAQLRWNWVRTVYYILN